LAVLEGKTPAVNDQDIGQLQTLILALQTAIFLCQLYVFSDQAKRLRQTVEGAKEQSGDMKRSIAESIRAANAMEEFAKSAERGSKAAAQSVVLVAQQMRAYLSARIDGGIYQDRAMNLRFEVRPMLINTGLTPARRISYVAKADVLPFPLPNDFVFPSLEPPSSVFGLLAPQQNFIMNAMVDRDFFDDGEVENIKRGNGIRLYIWGTVTYEDVFGDQRYTNFSHSIVWVPLKDGSERILGHYVDRHNDAT
jgi:hypothetical protein